MKRILLILICYLIYSSLLFPQKINTDSLEIVLDKTNDPAKKLELLKTLSNELSDKSLDKTLKFAKKGISISQKNKNTKELSQFLVDIGIAYSYANDFASSGSYFEQALKIRKALKDQDGIAYIYFQLAYNFYYQDIFDSVKFYCNKSIEISEKAENFEQAAKVYYLLAQLDRKTGKSKEALTNLEKTILYYEKTNNQDNKALVLNTIGQVSYDLGNYDEAIKYYLQALQIRKSLKDDNKSALLNYSIGNVYLAKGSFNEAISSYQESLGYFEKAGNDEGVANCYNNTALVYEKLIRNANIKYDKPHYENSIKYHNMALEMRKKTGNESEIANSFTNLANIYSRYAIDSMLYYYGKNWNDSIPKAEIQKILKHPMSLYEEALKIKTRLNDKTGIAQNLNNLGSINNLIGNYKIALSYLTQSIEINKELNNQNVLLLSYYEISRLMTKLKKYDEALKYFNLGTNLAITLGDKYMLKEFYLVQSLFYDDFGDCNKSMVFYKKYQLLLDEITSENNIKIIQDLNIKHETDAKEKEIKLQKSQIQQQRITLYAVALVLLLILGIAILLIKQNRERKRVNEKLEHQNEVITEQKQEITDSIRYASLIQTAAMPSKDLVEKYFSGSFIFFKPKDIVSGDFFWLKEIHGKIIVAAADCTGHGVPGAFMSMLGISNLNNIVGGMKEFHVDEILNELRRMIIVSLNQTGKMGENKDGMDIAMYIYDPEKKEIEYAGANNSLIMIRNGEIIETKANKMPIGIHDRVDEPFTRNVLKVEPGDMLYTFSDGYADQFGGEENKKFMSGKMKKMFASIANEPLDVQHNIIEKTNLDWRGDYVQIDDMLIIGVRI